MNNYFIITSIIIFLLTSLIWFAYSLRLKNKLSQLNSSLQNLNQNIEREILIRENESINELNKEIIRLKSEMAESRHSNYMEGYNKAKSEFFINITPYYEESKIGKDGFIINDICHIVNIGYKYQLYINNLPVLEPTIRWEKKLEEKKTVVDYKKIQLALEIIEKNLLPIVAQSNGVLRLVSIIK